jgi:hypothetical protein
LGCAIVLVAYWGESHAPEVSEIIGITVSYRIFIETCGSWERNSGHRWARANVLGEFEIVDAGVKVVLEIKVILSTRFVDILNGCSNIHNNCVLVFLKVICTA